MINKSSSPGAKLVSLDQLSYSAVPIHLVNIETKTKLADATGFLYKSGTHYFLITNWHNVTGVDPETMKRKSSMAASPTGLELPFIISKEPIRWEMRQLPLYDTSKNSNWYVHPTFGSAVDVIALYIGENDTDWPLAAVNECELDDVVPRVSDDIFILGFPHSIGGGGAFPIWKRGSIASEPDLDWKKLPRFLVDTASRPGMSGSPVIFRRQGVHGLVNGQATPETVIGEVQNFCGVYSGRLSGRSALDTQLGVVWKAAVVDEIVSGEIVEATYYPEEGFTSAE